MRGSPVHARASESRASERARAKVRALSVVLAAAGLLIAAAPAGAGTWVPQHVPPTQGGNGRQSAMSCPTSTSCVAVGYTQNSTGDERALTEVWDGSAWTLKTVTVPTGGTRTRLAAVSCTAADACTAVGHYSTATQDQLPLAARWNGSTWTRQTVPMPSGSSFGYLNGVSCTTTGGCQAVG